MEKKKATLADQYANIRDTLSRKINGVSLTTEKKLLDVQSGDDIRSGILSKLAKRYDKVENSSIADIEGKSRIYGNMELKDLIPQLMNLEQYKEMVSGGVNNITSEKVREQLYIKQFMPQVAKSLDAMVTMICGPKSNIDNGIETKKLNGITENEAIADMIKSKQFDEINRECITSALDHGISFMYIMPYKNMAMGILDMAKEMKRYVGTNMSTKVRQEENRMMSMSASSKYDTLFKENEDGSVDISSKLFSEVARTIVCPESIERITDDAEIRDKVKNKYFSESPYLNETMSTLISEIEDTHRSSNLFSENAFNGFNSFNQINKKVNTYNSRFLNKLSGCYVAKLDNERCIPIYINQNLIGIYYIEDEYNNIMKAVQQQKGKLRDDITTRANLNVKLKEEITKIIYEELDEKFLANNKHVIVSIDSLLRDLKRANTDFRIRFIPAEYIVEYSNYKRLSQLFLVEALAHCWIQLFKNFMFKELFYKQDKIITYYDISYNDDIGSQGNIFLDAFRNMVPLPSDILNLRKMYMGMINSQRMAIPKLGDEKPFEIDKIEGQKDNGETMEALTRIQGWVTELIGFNYNLMDIAGNVDFALQIVKEDRNKAELILSLQNRFNKPLNEAISKIIKYEFPEDKNLDIEAKLFECREIKEQFYAEETEKIKNKVELLSTIYLPEDADPELKRYFTRRCFELFAPGFIYAQQMNDILGDYARLNSTKPKTHKDEEEIGISNDNGDSEFGD